MAESGVQMLFGMVLAVGLGWIGGSPEEVGDEEASRNGVEGSAPGLDLWEKRLPWP